MEHLYNQNREEGKYKYCILYFLLVFLICLFFGINYFYTNEAFKENFIIKLNSEVICIKPSSEYKICIELNKENSNTTCITSENELKKCEVKEFNKKCKIYISELHLCLSKYLDSECEDIYQDLLSCNEWPETIEIRNKTIFK